MSENEYMSKRKEIIASGDTLDNTARRLAELTEAYVAENILIGKEKLA